MQIATAYRRFNTKSLLHQKLSFHVGDTPITPALDLLADLKTVSKIAQLPTDVHALVRVQTVETCGGRTGHHTLTDALHQARMAFVQRSSTSEDESS